MEIKAKIQKVLREKYGQFDSILEHEYEEVITEKLIEGPLERREEWATYNQVVLELKHALKDTLRLQELQYKLTDDSNPSEVIIEVIEDIKSFTPELERLYYKVKNF